MTVDHILFNKIKWVKESAYFKSYVGMKTTTVLENLIDETSLVGTKTIILAGAEVLAQKNTNDDVELYLWHEGQGISEDHPWIISLKKNPQVVGALA